MTTAISRKATVLALMTETTEGTPVKPSGSTVFATLQEGFAVSPKFENLTNNELQASIGLAKGELGLENPTFNMSHYVRASGVEGQEPDYKLLLEAVFGAKTVAAVERDLVAGSSVSSLNVDVGEGVGFERGQAVLVKDATWGLSIRNVLSVAADALTLAQNLAHAPAATTKLGKAVLYKVANSGHPTFTSWVYLGNGGAVEMVAGCRVTEMQISGQGGQYINASFNIAGIGYFFNPIIIAAADTKLDYTDDDGAHVATITAKTYKTPYDLMDALQAAINANSPSDAITVSYSSVTGKFTITSVGTAFSLEWLTGPNTANTIGDKIGFVVSADDTAALTYTSDNAQSYAAPYTPTYDSTRAIVAKSNEAWLGGAADTSCFAAQSVNVTLSNTKKDIVDICEDSGKSGSLFTGRTVKVNLVYLLKQHEAKRFENYRKGDTVQFTYNFGVKSGGQWVAGSSCNLFLPTSTITALDIVDQDGLCVVNVELTAYVDAGKGEFYLNFL